MKNRILIAGLTLALGASVALAQEETSEMTEVQKISYAIGINMGASLFDSEFAVDTDLIQQGLLDGLNDAEPKMSEEEIIAALTSFQKQIVAKQQEKTEMASKENRETGAAFLAENGARDGVMTTESGLQYEVLEAGDGAKPGPDDTVKVHYTGTLIDGTKFDSSVDRGEPATFKVNQVIAGWTEALQLMPAGSKWKLFIPTDLAYGDRAGGPIPAGSTLVFEVELIEVQ